MFVSIDIRRIILIKEVFAPPHASLHKGTSRNYFIYSLILPTVLHDIKEQPITSSSICFNLYSPFLQNYTQVLQKKQQQGNKMKRVASDGNSWSLGHFLPYSFSSGNLLPPSR